jgi:hypothetical protein
MATEIRIICDGLNACKAIYSIHPNQCKRFAFSLSEAPPPPPLQHNNNNVDWWHSVHVCFVSCCNKNVQTGALSLLVSGMQKEGGGGGGMHQLHQNKLVFLAASASAACVL